MADKSQRKENTISRRTGNIIQKIMGYRVRPNFRPQLALRITYEDGGTSTYTSDNYFNPNEFVERLAPRDFTSQNMSNLMLDLINFPNESRLIPQDYARFLANFLSQKSHPHSLVTEPNHQGYSEVKHTLARDVVDDVYRGLDMLNDSYVNHNIASYRDSATTSTNSSDNTSKDPSNNLPEWQLPRKKMLEAITKGNIIPWESTKERSIAVQSTRSSSPATKEEILVHPEILSEPPPAGDPQEEIIQNDPKIVPLTKENVNQLLRHGKFRRIKGNSNSSHDSTVRDGAVDDEESAKGSSIITTVVQKRRPLMSSSSSSDNDHVYKLFPPRDDNRDDPTYGEPSSSPSRVEIIRKKPSTIPKRKKITIPDVENTDFNRFQKNVLWQDHLDKLEKRRQEKRKLMDDFDGSTIFSGDTLFGNYGVEEPRVNIEPDIMERRHAGNIPLRTLPMSKERRRNLRISEQQKHPQSYQRMLHPRNVTDDDLSPSVKFSLTKKTQSGKTLKVRNKTVAQKFVCKFCKKEYTTKGTLERHEMDSHCNGLLNLCICGLLTGSNFKHERHMLSVQSQAFANFYRDINIMKSNNILPPDYRWQHHRSVKVPVFGPPDASLRFAVAPEHAHNIFYAFFVQNAKIIYRSQLFVKNCTEHDGENDDYEDEE